MRSATQRKLVVPRYRLNGFHPRRFAVAGPSTWNSLPDSLRDPELSLNTFKRQLKTYIFTRYWQQNVLSALEMIFWVCAIQIYTLLTYLLTYRNIGSLLPSHCADLWWYFYHNVRPCVGDGILKIRHYLAKIWTKVWCRVFDWQL